MASQPAYPLSWPVGWKRTDRWSVQSAPFGNHSLARATDEVVDQLRLLRAKNVVISTNIEIRLDGFPRSGQKRPNDCGVAVYFTLNKKDHVLACDKWNTVEANLWAIGKHIDAMRGQNRWGVGTLEQAFLGYAQLPPGQPEWWIVLGVTPTASMADIQDAYIAKAKQAHPDAGGDNDAMRTLNAAREAALKSHGVR